MIAADFFLDLSPLENVRGSAVRMALRQGINKAAAPVKAAVVSGAERIKLRGFIAKSIRIKVKMYDQSTKWVAVIGPGSKFSRARPGKKPKGKPRQRIFPAHYAHFTEKGTGRMNPKPFLKPALDATRGRFLEAIRINMKEKLAAVMQPKK